MKRVPLTASKALTYGTRRLRAGDTFEASRQDARVLTAVGLARETAAQAVPAPRNVKLRVTEPAALQVPDELATLREAYKAKTGRNPHYRWDAERIREAIASLDAQDNG